jgi:hypothetical protein
MDWQVRQALKVRGEYWRIRSLPSSNTEIEQWISTARTALGGLPMYYYNAVTGTRLVTYQEFAQLANLADLELGRHLAEIQDYCQRRNRNRYPEVDFFLAGDSFPEKLLPHDFRALQGKPLREVHAALVAAFRALVPLELQEDKLDSPPWRQQMFSALVPGDSDDQIDDDAELGLSAEFFRQLQWLPGGRIEEGELIFDSVFEETGAEAADARARGLCDEKARGFIFNLVREYGDLEYVNVGRVIEPLSGRDEIRGRRGVYLVQIKMRAHEQKILKIVRLQKWGVAEHLDENKGILQAILESEEYTEFVLDRRLGCRQLGMNLPPRITMRRIAETYCGDQHDYHETRIWTPYFERDYVPGQATCRVSPQRFTDQQFACQFARLLGLAAASNLIVGRCDLKQRVMFDDGDEVLVEDKRQIPVDIVVADPTGAFRGFQQPLESFARSYAKPILKRADKVPDPRSFAEAYLTALRERFTHIQAEYRRRRRAFDTLFRHQPRDEAGNFAYRWERVLQRLDATDVARLEQAIRQELRGLSTGSSPTRGERQSR